MRNHPAGRDGLATGMVDVVVVYWAYGEAIRFAVRAGADDADAEYRLDRVDNVFSYSHGLSTGGAGRDDRRALPHPSGATNVDFGVVSVADCKPAPVNPKAHFYGKPIRLGDQQNSRWIGEPLRLPKSL